jgi:hypothetical protein
MEVQKRTGHCGKISGTASCRRKEMSIPHEQYPVTRSKRPRLIRAEGALDDTLLARTGIRGPVEQPETRMLVREAIESGRPRRDAR